MYPGANNTELVPTRFFTGDPLYRDGRVPGRRARSRAGARPTGGRTTTALAARARAPAQPRTATRCCGTGTASRPKLPWLFEGRLPDLNLGTAGGASCAPSLRGALMRGARRRSARSATSSTAASRAATSRATTAGRGEGVHAVQLEMGLARLHGRDARVAPADRARCANDRRAAAGAARPAAGDARLAPRWPLSAPVASLWAPLAWLAGGWHERRAAARRRRRPLGRGDGRRRGAAGRCAGARRPGAARRSSTRTATPSSAPSPAWPSGARRRATTSGRGATACTRVALRITPEQLRAIAAQLYVELLRGGYTQVCEFHYLHRERDGSDYADPLAMSWALADAAADAGIGLTLLPVLYERSGFARRRCATDQRRFRASAERDVRRRLGASRAAARPLVDAGVAIHSLRAASAGGDRRRSRARADGLDGPIHIHVAEQTAEVDDCLARDRHAADRMARRASAGSTRAGSSSTRPMPCRPRSRRSRRAAPASSSARAPRPTSATACSTCRAGSPPACRWRSAPTARRRATGARSCACSNTASGWRGASATSPRRPSSASRRAAERLFAPDGRGIARGDASIGVGPGGGRAGRRAARRSARRRAARHRSAPLARCARLQQPERRRGAT